MRLLLVIAAIAFSLTEASYHVGALSGLDQAYTDLWHRWSGVRYQPTRTALVVVDEASLTRYPDDPRVFWPPHFAKAAATLREAGATVIGIDFLFSITPESWFNKLNLAGNEALRQYDLAFRQELNSGKVVLVGTIAHGEDGHPGSLLLPHTDYLLSLPNMDLVAGIGLADLEPDQDGVIRRFRFAPRLNLPKELAAGAPQLSLGALLAMRASAQSVSAGQWHIGGFRYDASSVHNISFAGPQGTIPRLPIYRLLDKNALSDPAVQALRGKVVIIGGDYLGMNDIHATPYSSSLAGRLGTRVTGMPGAELQANIVESLLSGITTAPASGLLRGLLVAVVLLAATAALLRMPPGVGFAVVVTAALLALVIGYLAFQQFLLFPSASLQLGFAVGVFYGAGAAAHARRARQGAHPQHVRGLCL